MITFKQQLTVPEELVQGLALQLGYQTELPEEGGVLVPNPQSAEDFIQERAREHMENFFLPYGQILIEEQLKSARQQLAQQIIGPIREAFVTEVIHEE